MIVSLLSLVSCAIDTSHAAPEWSRRIQPRWVGAQLPEFRVKNADYEVITFSPKQFTAPTVFIFYRGGWSSECQRHLRRLKEAHATLRRMGFSVVFLSADAPHNLRVNPRIAALPYELLSDSQMQAARAFGVAYRVDDFTAGRYEHFGVDLEIASGESHHELALPSAFIVDRTGMIRFAYWRPTGIRIEAEDLIAAAKKLDGTHDSVAARAENAMAKE